MICPFPDIALFAYSHKYPCSVPGYLDPSELEFSGMLAQYQKPLISAVFAFCTMIPLFGLASSGVSPLRSQSGDPNRYLPAAHHL